MPTRDDYIYVAGLFDGEGCAMIQYRALRLAHRPVARIKMTSKETITWLRDTFGGNISFEPSRANQSAAWRWELSGDSALRFYAEILPFLRTKRPQALVMSVYAELPKARRGAKLPAWVVGQRDAFRDMIQELNQRKNSKFKRREVNRCSR